MGVDMSKLRARVRCRPSVIGLFLFLAVSTIAILFAAHGAVQNVQERLLTSQSAPVGPLDGLELSDAPANVYHDRKRGTLTIIGGIDDERKRALVALTREAPQEIAASKAVYLDAVNRLAFQSVQASRKLLVPLLILGGVAGALGVQLRSIINFIGNACYKGNLKVERWWPYYALRPLSGFILGAVLVGIILAGFLSPEDHATSKVMWWTALSFLAGFVDEEFAQRLRSVSKQ